MIEASGVSKRFGRRKVLDRLDVTVAPGALTLLLGSNGAGKTTLLRILVGLTDPDAGRVLINGVDRRENPRLAASQLSFLPQSPSFNPRLTTGQVLAFYAKLRAVGRDACLRVEEHWGLNDHHKARTGQLSGGLRQRLALAVFSLADVPVLILDEPGLSLDPIWRERLQLHLSERARNGATVLVATHLLGEWEKEGERLLLLENGSRASEIEADQIRSRLLGARETESTAGNP